MNHYANNNMILKYLLQMKEHQGENKSIVIGEDFIHVSLRKLKQIRKIVVAVEHLDKTMHELGLIYIFSV